MTAKTTPKPAPIFTDPADPAVWEALAAPFDASSWIEKLPKQLRRDDRDKYPCKKGTQASADGHYCGGYHARSVHLDYIGHAGVTMRLNAVVGPVGWELEPLATTEEGLPMMARGEFWAKLTILGVSHVDVATNYNSTQEAWGDALRRTAMRFGIGTYLWAKSEFAAELAAFREPAPGESPAERAQADADKLAEQRWPAATLDTVERFATEGGYVDESVKFRGNTMTLGGALALCRAEAREDVEKAEKAAAVAAQEASAAPVAPQEPATAPQAAQEAPVGPQGQEDLSQAARDVAGLALAIADKEQLKATWSGATDLHALDVLPALTDTDRETLGVPPDVAAVSLGALLMQAAKYLDTHGVPVRYDGDPWAADEAADNG